MFDNEPLDEDALKKLHKGIEDQEFSPKYLYEIKEEEITFNEVQGKKYGQFEDDK